VVCTYPLFTNTYFLVPFYTAEPFKTLPTQGTQIGSHICVTFQVYPCSKCKGKIHYVLNWSQLNCLQPEGMKQVMFEIDPYSKPHHHTHIFFSQNDFAKCCFKSLWFIKLFPHCTRHVKGFSPVWTLNSQWTENFCCLWNSVYTDDFKWFSLKWILTCLLRVTFCLKLFPHWSHV